MAGGLFAVYRDPGAVEPAPPASRRANGASSNSNNNTRKKDGAFAVWTDSTRPAALIRALEKENLDPSRLGGGKKAALGAKAKNVKPSDGRSSCGPVKAVMGERRVKRVTPVASTNGICTGSLTTRELPPLPPLEPESTSPRASMPSRTASPPRRTLSSPVVECGDSPASNVDSGYGKVSDSERALDYDDESDMSLDVDDAFDPRESDRRARALTESPLAEITQAFTGLGRFSNAPASPSPSSQTLVAQIRRSALPPAPKTHKPSSPSKSLSALPPRLRPYSTTATTRKVKPGQTTADVPKLGPSATATATRSLRF
ncbi:hypothetical protein JCM11491_002892 [Sporobolomyces phaffii]